MSVASLRGRLAEAYAALSLPGWLDVYHDDTRRQWCTPSGRLTSIVAVLGGRSIRIVTWMPDGEEARVVVLAPELVQPVLEAVALAVVSL